MFDNFILLCFSIHFPFIQKEFLSLPSRPLGPVLMHVHEVSTRITRKVSQRLESLTPRSAILSPRKKRSYFAESMKYKSDQAWLPAENHPDRAAQSVVLRLPTKVHPESSMEQVYAPSSSCCRMLRIEHCNSVCVHLLEPRGASSNFAPLGCCTKCRTRPAMLESVHPSARMQQIPLAPPGPLQCTQALRGVFGAFRHYCHCSSARLSAGHSLCCATCDRGG